MAEPTVEDRPTTESEEIARLREENLRLRDLLIAKDAELGSALGQVLALEAGTARLLNVVGRIRSLVPSLVWKVLVRLRGRGSQS